MGFGRRRGLPGGGGELPIPYRGSGRMARSSSATPSIWTVGSQVLGGMPWLFGDCCGGGGGLEATDELVRDDPFGDEGEAGTKARGRDLGAAPNSAFASAVAAPPAPTSK